MQTCSIPTEQVKTHLGFSYKLRRVRQAEANGQANLSWCFELVSYLERDVVKVTKGP